MRRSASMAENRETSLDRAPGIKVAANGPAAIETVLAILAAAGGAITGLLLTRENRVAPFPWHHDDYTNLDWAGVSVHFGVVRPVSYAIWSVAGRFGPEGLYVGLFAMVAALLGLSVLWVAEVIEAARTRSMLMMVSFTTALVFFLFELSPWTLRYTGHMTNGGSAAFGIGAGVLALRQRKVVSPSFVAMLLLYGLSAFAKEDFLLLPMVSTAVAGWNGHTAGDRSALVRAGITLAALATIAAAAILYNVSVSSPFLFGVGTYEARLYPSSLVATALWYLTCTRFARSVLLLAGVATVLSVRARFAAPVRWLAVWLGVASLIVPYLPLAEHRYALYASNWLPISIAAVGWTLVDIVRAEPRRWVRVLPAILAVASIVGLYRVARSERHAQARYITDAQEWSRAAVAKAAAQAGRPVPLRFIGVAGADAFAHGPWFASDGVFLNRLVGRDIRWIVLLRKDSLARQVIRENGWPMDRGRIVNVDESCRATLRANGIPILDVGPLPARTDNAPIDAVVVRDPRECGM